MKVIEERENLFFERKELKIILEHTGASTPPKEQLIKELAEKYSVPAEHIVVDFISSKKGVSSSEASVKIYKEKPKVKIKKEGKKVEKGEAPAS